MSKKIISAVLAASMAASLMTAAVAADGVPTVIVDSRIVTFLDQDPVIIEDRTLIPARGVFEAMGASVEWWNEERMVVVRSEDNKTRVDLTIDDPIMKVHTFTNLTSADTEEVELEVAPQIMNDRTMIPLRAVGEALGAEVSWDQENYVATITSKTIPTVIKTTPAPEGEQPSATASPSATADPSATIDPSATASPEPTTAPGGVMYESSIPVIYAFSDKTTVSVGEEFSVYVAVSCCDKETYSAVNTMLYDDENFEFVNFEYKYPTQDFATLGGSNPEFMGNSVKCLILPATVEEHLLPSEGVILELTFKAKNAAVGEFALSSRKTDRGYDNILYFNDDTSAQEADELYIDTTPVVITAQ